MYLFAIENSRGISLHNDKGLIEVYPKLLINEALPYIREYIEIYEIQSIRDYQNVCIVYHIYDLDGVTNDHTVHHS